MLSRLVPVLGLFITLFAVSGLVGALHRRADNKRAGLALLTAALLLAIGLTVVWLGFAS